LPVCQPYRRVAFLLGICPRGIFFGQQEKTITQGGAGGIAGEVAATFGLFAKVE
jgi:hypothetical protein